MMNHTKNEIQINKKIQTKIKMKTTANKYIKVATMIIILTKIIAKKILQIEMIIQTGNTIKKKEY